MKLSLVVALVMVAGCVGDAPPDPDLGDGSGDLGDSPDAMTGCASVTTVLLYSEDTYDLTLPNAFAAAPVSCTRYYVDLPHLTTDSTMPRPGADKVHALGASFHAMAEFSWSGWANWIAASPGTRDWASAGRQFRQRMVDAGYDVAAGDTWVINEFPSSTHTGDNDVWQHEADAVKSLDEGDGSHPTKGAVLLEGMGQNLVNFAVYKPNVEGWLQHDAFWTAMSAHVRWFGQEVYADPHFNCVTGSNVATATTHLDAYLEHIPELAEASGGRASAAVAFLTSAYVPLLNEAWNSNAGFGNDVIDLGDFEKFSRLQIYSTHVWAANHPYPGRRIGFAWAPRNETAAQDSALSSVIANSVARAYPSQEFYGLGKYACSTDGNLAGCGCTVSGGYNTGWNTFATW